MLRIFRSSVVLSLVLTSFFSTMANTEEEKLFSCSSTGPIDEGGHRFYVEIKQESNEFILYAYKMLRTGRYENRKTPLFTEKVLLTEQDRTTVFQNTELSSIKFRLEMHLDEPYGMSHIYGNYMELTHGIEFELSCLYHPLLMID